MQAQTSIRLPDTSITLPFVCLFSEAFADTSISTGKERDTESGNDYFKYRYLASSMGRWTSPDPSGLFFADAGNPQSLNLYAYVQNNPLAFSDPNGLQAAPAGYCGWLCRLVNWFHNHSGGGGGGGDDPPSPPPFGGHWTTHQPSSGHYLTTALYPPGAGWFGHFVDAVDTQNTNGWATAKNFTPLDRVGAMVGVPFKGMERSDHVTYAKHLSGFGHPRFLYHPISDDGYASITDRIAGRYDPDYGAQHQYELFLNSCGQNVGDDIRAAGIKGAPPRILFGPWLDYFWLRIQAR